MTESGADSTTPKKGLVIVSPVFPFPVRDGSTLRVVDMAFHLSRFYRISFVILSPEAIAADRLRPLRAIAAAVEVVRDPLAGRGPAFACRRLYWRVWGRIRRPRPFWRRYCPAALTRAVERMVSAQDASCVLVNTAGLAPSVRTVRDRVFTAIDTHDVWHERYREFAAMGRGAVLEHFRDPADEARLLRTADCVVAITDDDAAVFSRLIPGGRIVVAGVSRPALGRERTNAEDLPLVVFFGGRGTTNEDAAAYFIESIWPTVLNQVPNAEFCVLNAGEEVKRAYAGYPNVRLLGYQQDLRSWYEKAWVVVDPLRFGTGLKIKVVEALSFGSAMVMTQVAARGIRGRNDDHYLVRDDPEGFAAAVIVLLQDAKARAELQKNALAFAREAFAPDRVYGDLVSALP